MSVNFLHIVLLLLIALATYAYLSGKRKALSLAGVPASFPSDTPLKGASLLHSLPGYHGAWVMLVALGPAFLLFALWSLLSTGLEKSYLFAQFHDHVSTLGVAQQDGLWREVVAAVSPQPNATTTAPSQITAQMADRLKSVRNVSLFAVITLMVIAIFTGFHYSLSRISLSFRARHRVEAFVKVLLFMASGVAVLTTLGIILSLIAESLRFFQSINIFGFLFGLEWTPQQMAFRADQAGGSAAFGIIPLLTGTLLITVIAMSVAAPIGLLSAVYLSDYASPKVRAFGKPMLEVLAGIPTVVYGFFAALTVAPFVRDVGQGLGLHVASESAMAAGLVMGIMIVPFVSSLSDDVINAVPQSLRDGSYALGATKSETILKVVLPAALPGIVSALILAISRAIGETMIVVMAAGLAANLSFNPLDAVTTVTVQIGTLLTGDQEFDSPKTLAAFALGLTLFVITLLLNLVALRVVKKYREQYD
jgi:phosphate transport system permease protein